MMPDEASSLIKRKEEDFIDKWNQTRYIVYSVIQSQSTNELNPQDILKFPWEKEDIVETKTKTKEELLIHAKQMELVLNKNNNN